MFNAPGATELTSIPNSTSSSARVSANLTTPACWRHTRSSGASVLWRRPGNHDDLAARALSLRDHGPTCVSTVPSRLIVIASAHSSQLTSSIRPLGP